MTARAPNDGAIWLRTAQGQAERIAPWRPDIADDFVKHQGARAIRSPDPKASANLPAREMLRIVGDFVGRQFAARDKQISALEARVAKPTALPLSRQVAPPPTSRQLIAIARARAAISRADWVLRNGRC